MLQFVPIAVLSAIIFPEIVNESSTNNILLNLPRIFAGIIAIGIAWRTKNVILTIITGLLVLYIFNFLLSL
jgi:branched-subunit amino acid transport protein